MKTSLATTTCIFLLSLNLNGLAATLYVDLNSPNPTAPYSDWTTATTNIQTAIDAAVAGDLVLVTNGLYATGGKVMAGDLTNRVTIDKAITVQSVNGWSMTVIQGEKDPATNGPAAVRCAWLTNGAILVGFTLRNGATRAVGDQSSLRSGGGVWASGTNGFVSNCLLLENAAQYGGGAYRGWFDRCTLKANAAQFDGGGGYSNMASRCLIAENFARANGGGMYGGRSYNSAITANAAFNGGGGYGGVFLNSTITFNKAANTGGGAFLAPGTAVTNSIVVSNTALTSPDLSNGGLVRYSCTSPLLPGTGNIAADPLLLADGIHISSNSPCRAAGSSIAASTDLDGQTWNSPPAMGCDEWQPEPVVSAAKLYFDVWGKVHVSAIAIGQPPFTYHWFKDGGLLAEGESLSGTDTENLIINRVSPTDAGRYQLVASNSLGVVTSQVALLTIRFVNANGTAAAPPYSDWTSAATNIQDAVDGAGFGDLILVASGIYGRGGKVMAGDLTNRVALDKPVTLMSVNGPSATVIQGAWDVGATNGPGAVRGVWMTDGAALIGFAVREGATRGFVGDGVNLQTGGGVWCSSTNSRILNCIIHHNAAGGGGGGGVFRGTLLNSWVMGNAAGGNGAGTAFSSLVNCTVVENIVQTLITAGVYGQSTNRVFNSIVWGNYRPNSSSLLEYSGVMLTNCCTRPLPAGAGNISIDPLLESDGIHLQAGSPCLNAGSSNFVVGVDLDGQPWTSQPSMGCDERLLQLAVGQPAIIPTGDGRIRLRVSPVGAAVENYRWFKDGILLANGARISGVQSAEMAISSFDPADAGFYQAVLTNSLGSVTSAVVQIRPHFVAASSPAPTPPYTTWGTAAATIQDAIDNANYGDLVVVADGIYSSGGGVVSGDLTNRVAISKGVAVASLSGPTNAIIEGQMDFAGPNGNGQSAVRAVWLENWTSLAGFTVRGGATRTNGDATALQSGGGVWGQGATAFVTGCIITNNSAQENGGGAHRVQIGQCLLTRNLASGGGGAYGSRIENCYLVGNQALNHGGGGASGSILRNSLVHKNTAVIPSGGAYGGGGTSGCTIYDCTVTENVGNGLFFDSAYNTIAWGNTPRDYSGSLIMNYCCAKYGVFDYGTNNLYIDPQLVDSFHLSVDSPCRAAGGPLYVSGTDLDGDAWLNPISIGADEFIVGGRVGPLSVTIETATNSVFPNRSLPLIGRIAGLASRVDWLFGDSTMVTNLSYATAHAWANPGDYTVTFTAYNGSNPAGVSTSAVIHVLPIESPSWASMEKIVYSDTYHYYQFSFNTQVGAINTLEYATNLVPPINWMTLTTSIATNVVMKVFDFDPTNDVRFYRLHAQ